MARTFECEDTKLLGYGSAVVHGQAASYIVIDAEAQAGLGKVTTRFIYLKSNCTRKDVDEAIRKYHNKSSHLLQPASGKIPHGVGPYPVNQLEDLVWQKLVDQYFEDYLRDGLNSIVADEHFIDPSSSDGPVMKVLQEYMTGNYGRDDGQLKVIKAGPGVGKTTVSRTLVHRLANTASSTKMIPIYVEAQHWMNNLQTDSRLYDVIKNSMALLSARFVRRALQLSRP